MKDLPRDRFEHPIACTFRDAAERSILEGAITRNGKHFRYYDLTELLEASCIKPALEEAIDEGVVRLLWLTAETASQLHIEGAIPVSGDQSQVVSVTATQFIMADYTALSSGGSDEPPPSGGANASSSSKELVKPANTMGPQGSICKLAKVRLRPSLESSPPGTSTAVLNTDSLREAEASRRANTPRSEVASARTDADNPNAASTEAPEINESGTLPEPPESRPRICRLLNSAFKKRRKRSRRRLRRPPTERYQRIGERCERMNIRIHKRDLELIKEICPDGTKVTSWVRSILLGADPIKIALQNYRSKRASQEANISNNISQIRRRTNDLDMIEQPEPCLVIFTQTQIFKELIEAIPKPRVVRKKRKAVQFTKSGFDNNIRLWVSKEEKDRIDGRSGTTKRGRSKWIRAELSNAVNRILSSSLEKESSIETIVQYGKKLNDDIAIKLNYEKAAGIPSDARQASHDLGNLIDSLTRKYPPHTKGTS
jgi:hypothetical protein